MTFKSILLSSVFAFSFIPVVMAAPGVTIDTDQTSFSGNYDGNTVGINIYGGGAANASITMTLTGDVTANNNSGSGAPNGYGIYQWYNVTNLNINATLGSGYKLTANGNMSPSAGGGMTFGNATISDVILTADGNQNAGLYLSGTFTYTNYTDANNFNLTNNVFTNSNSPGVGFWGTFSSNKTVNSNSVSITGNGGDGIRLQFGANAFFNGLASDSGSFLHLNDNYQGMDIISSNISVKDSNIQIDRSTGYDGIYAYNGSVLSFAGNAAGTNTMQVNANNRNGMTADTSVNVTIKDFDTVTFDANKNSAIELDNGAVLQVTDADVNLINSVAGHGIKTANFATATFTDNTTHDRTLNISGNGGDGIFVTNAGGVSVNNMNVILSDNTIGAYTEYGTINFTGETGGSNTFTANGNGTGFWAFGVNQINVSNMDIEFKDNTSAISATSGGLITLTGVAAKNNMVLENNDDAIYAAGAGSKITLKNLDVTSDGVYYAKTFDAGAVEMDNTAAVTNTGYGFVMQAGGNVVMKNNSSLLTKGASNFALYSAMDAGKENVLDITDGSIGSADFVTIGTYGGLMTVNATNATLYSDIGELASVHNSVNDLSAGILALTGDNATLTGSIVTDAGNTSQIDLTDSTWAMKNTSNVTDLTLTDSTLDMHSDNAGGFNTMTVTGNYTSSGGKIVMNTHLGNDASFTDKIILDGAIVSGATTLFINDVSPNNKGAQTLNGIKVVDAINGAVTSASDFVLDGGQLDSTAYVYVLTQGNKSGTDMDSFFLQSTGKMSDIAKTIANMPAVHLNIVKTGMNNLRKRMGELRDSDPEKHNGLWARGFAKNLEVDDDIKTKMNVYGAEAGGDIQVYSDETNTVYIGAMVGYMKTDNMRTHQSNNKTGKGDGDTPSIGIYGTWLNEKGWFMDSTLRSFWSQLDLTSYNAQGLGISYDADRQYTAFSVEAGRRFSFDHKKDAKFILEPKAEFQYAYAKSKDFSTSTGADVRYGKTQSIVGRAAVMGGYNTRLDNGMIAEPFVELGLNYEFDGETDIQYTGVNYKSDLGGLGYEIGFGLNMKLTDAWHFYSDVMYENGKSVEAYSANIGVRFNF